MRSRSKNFRGILSVSRKAVLGVILLSATPYALIDSIQHSQYWAFHFAYLICGLGE